MRISVIGLGYVGTVSAACFAARGHEVTGVDVAAKKVDLINSGRSPVLEPDLDSLVSEAVQAKRLRATMDPAEAILATDVSLVCVGTPSQTNGSLDLTYVERVAAEIGAALRHREGYHVVAFRSTMLPGTVERRLIGILEESSQRRVGVDFGVGMNPEFLREGTSIVDFNEPPRIVIGQLDERSGDVILAAYEGIDAPVVRVSIQTAEMVKYADNAFHALKITFANEIGNICKNEGIDGRDLMDIFCLDTKLNLSPTYLKPGGAFGGSCLPKDLRALIYHARVNDLRVPVLESVLASNDAQKRIGFELIKRTNKRKIGILGLSFKPDTDDLRESPAVELAESLIGKGFDLAIYDKNVSLAALIGANRSYIEHEIPHIASLMRETVAEVAEHAEVLVVTTKDPEFASLLAAPANGRIIIDLAGLAPRGRTHEKIDGICW